MRKLNFKIGLAVMSDWQYKFPAPVYMYTLLAAHLNSTFNPIFYALFNPSFKKGYFMIFECVKKKLKITTQVRTPVVKIKTISFRAEKCVESLRLNRIR